jgi:EAL domain-containing protein (putative c-di-GMP-specific phosphodiesterase class I)
MAQIDHYVAEPSQIWAEPSQVWPIRFSPIHRVEHAPSWIAEPPDRILRRPVVPGKRARPHPLPWARANPGLTVQPIHTVAGVLCGAETVTPKLPPDQLSWLLHAACRAACNWNSANGGDLHEARALLRVAVGLPPDGLREGGVPAQAEAALQHSDLPPHLLELGLSSQAIRDDTPETLAALAALRDLGTGLALDGFAGGLDGFRALRRVKLNSVRLDPDLIRGLQEERDARAVVATIVQFAHAQDTRVVALGVETTLQRDILADLGCDEAQGPLLGGLMAAETFSSALRFMADENR